MCKSCIYSILHVHISILNVSLFLFQYLVAIAQGGAIQISNPASDGVQGLQTLTMTNSGAPQPGATIVQYAAQTPDGTQQFFVPGSQVVVQGIVLFYCLSYLKLSLCAFLLAFWFLAVLNQRRIVNLRI